MYRAVICTICRPGSTGREVLIDATMRTLYEGMRDR